MNRAIGVTLLILLGAAALVGLSSVFIVSQTQYALVLQFGEIKTAIKKPGLYFKIPFLQSIQYLDNRILSLDTPPEEVIASDRKRLVVDAFSRYRINNPEAFYRTLRTESNAGLRLQPIVSSAVRNTLGSQTFSAVLSDKRAQLMQQIRGVVNLQAEEIGIEIVDVRIRRADLPEANSQAIYSRMQTERQQEAAEIRAEGAEESLRIRSRADRDVTVLLADAKRESEILRGQGDGERNRIFAEAFSQDPDFFGFYRSMLAYQESMKAGDTTLVLEPDSDFFKYFGNSGGR